MNKNKILATFWLFTAAVAASTPAYSKSYSDPFDLGTLDEGLTWFSEYHRPYEWFEDEWTFSLDQTSTVAIEVKDFEYDIDLYSNNIQILGIDNLQVEFEGQVGGEYDWLMQTLAAGTYTFSVSGDVDGKLGGFYKGKVDVQPVPLPAALLLFGSSLMGLVALARKRIQSGVVSA